MYFSSYTNDALRYSASATSDIGIGPPGVATRVPGATTSSTALSASQAVWPTASALDPILAGLKRSSEALYHPTVLSAYNTIGQTEAWYSTNSITKRLRYEGASNLPIYPQRPGEKDCAFYMQTRTCKYGDSCKFDHPIWVPEGGIPDWKEVPINVTSESLPERPGEPDCPYFLKTQRCKYGSRCKFNHPKELVATVNADASSLPERPSEPLCAFYMKTGTCKFGSTCKFHHPKDIQIQSGGQENNNVIQTESTIKTKGVTGDVKPVNPIISCTPAFMHNTKGLPVRLGEADCPFYLKTGSCKYGATCRYNHPERNAINPPAAALGHSILASQAAAFNVGIVSPSAVYDPTDPRFSHAIVGLGQTIYPLRPGQLPCEYYMKTGLCKFGERCKFDHPVDRLAASQSQLEPPENVKLTLAGLPRREGSIICPYYLKTGACKFGASCKFDHPPPGEVMTMATSQETSTAGEAKGDN